MFLLVVSSKFMYAGIFMFGILSRKTDDVKRVYNNTYIAVSTLATHFRLAPSELNKVFLELRWIENSNSWFVPTTLGKAKGAFGKYSHENKQKYMVWHEKIKSNFELIKHIKYFKELNKPEVINKDEVKVKDNLYEKFIYNKYKNMNYIVASNNKKNSEIDLIAIKNKEILFIQCKNWTSDTSKKITDTNIKKTRKKVVDFLEENPMFDSDNYKKKTIYITSESILHWRAKHYLSKHDDIEHLLIPMSNRL